MPRRRLTSGEITFAFNARQAGWSWRRIADELQVAGESTVREAVFRNYGVDRNLTRSLAGVTASEQRWRQRTSRAVNRILNPRNRTYGIEIEFHTAIRADVVRAVEAVVGYHIHMLSYHGNQCVTCGQRVTGYSQWKLETDSSATSGMLNAGAQPYNQGGELVSPVLNGEEGLQEIQQVMQALRSVGAKVDRRHGLHVHIGAQDMTGVKLGDLIANYSKTQNVFYQLVGKSRKNNIYCRPNPMQELADNRLRARANQPLLRLEKYRGMNFSPLGRIGTIEMRMHQGTLNGKKATEWIRFLVGFFNATENGELDFEESVFETLCFGGYITESTKNYLTGRIDALNRQLQTA